MRVSMCFDACFDKCFDVFRCGSMRVIWWLEHAMYGSTRKYQVFICSVSICVSICVVCVEWELTCENECAYLFEVQHRARRDRSYQLLAMPWSHSRLDDDIEIPPPLFLDEHAMARHWWTRPIRFLWGSVLQVRDYLWLWRARWFRTEARLGRVERALDAMWNNQPLAWDVQNWRVYFEHDPTIETDDEESD